MIAVLNRAVLVNVSNTILVSPCPWRPHPAAPVGLTYLRVIFVANLLGDKSAT